jgi:hypothetical protein
MDAATNGACDAAVAELGLRRRRQHLKGSPPMMPSSRTIKTAAMAIAVVGASLFGAVSAHASGCATYGKLSLQQQRQNEQKNCGFSGPSWSSDLRKHIQWCSSVGPDQWKAELQKREKMLAQECKS